MRQNIQNNNFSECVAIVPPVGASVQAAAAGAKTFTVPRNQMWKVTFLQAIITSSAVVGNRQVALQVKDASGTTLLDLVAGAVQAASLARTYNFLQAAQRETAFVGNALQATLPADLYLAPGYSLKVYDSANIDAAGDTLAATMQFENYNI